MAFLYYLIIFVHVVACLFLIAVVLLQQGKGQDLASAFGGGGTQTAFGPRGSATVLSRATTILAGVFMVTSLALSLIRPSRSSVLDQVPGVAATPTPAAKRRARARAGRPGGACRGSGRRAGSGSLPHAEVTQSPDPSGDCVIPTSLVRPGERGIRRDCGPLARHDWAPRGEMDFARGDRPSPGRDSG